MKKLLVLISLMLTLTGCAGINTDDIKDVNIASANISTTFATPTNINIASDIPEYNGTKVIELNNNIPNLDKKDGNKVFETYSDLDSLNRCGVAYANICKELMPTEDRGAIGQIKPSGWHTVKYDFVDGKYLYNRCHLIAFCLAGENANEKNLVTGTRSFNVKSMYYYEDMVNDYMKANPNNHVLYRVTPIFIDNELVCRGVQMEALSIEDDGICFNVFCYNVEDDVEIDYLTGESHLVDEVVTTTVEEQKPEVHANPEGITYIINTSSKKIHTENCRYANSKNTESYNGTLDYLENDGYTRCKVCNP